jgi:hypothetical protein
MRPFGNPSCFENTPSCRVFRVLSRQRARVFRVLSRRVFRVLSRQRERVFRVLSRVFRFLSALLFLQTGHFFGVLGVTQKMAMYLA